MLEFFSHSCCFSDSSQALAWQACVSNRHNRRLSCRWARNASCACCTFSSEHVELWLHVHRIHRIHLLDGLFCHLDWCCSTIGQLVAWAWLYKFIQKEGNERGLRSLSSLVSEKAGAPEAKLAAVLSVFFLSIYAAAQLTAGGKALFVMLGWPELVGILIGFVLV